MNSRTVLLLASFTVLLTVAQHAQTQEPNPTASLPDNEAQAKARAVLYDESTATAKPMLSTHPAPATAASIAQVPAGGSLPDNEAQAKARASIRADTVTPGQQSAASSSISQEEAASPMPDSEAQTKARASVRLDTAPAANPLTSGMAAPALPITPAQQQQLDELLLLYRSDSISASEYHAKRAEIIANK